jgi:hypothetical protein
MLLPKATGSGLSEMAIDTPATVVGDASLTVVVSVEELLVPLGSLVDELTVVVFVITVPPATLELVWTTRVTVADAPSARVPRLQE